MKRLAAVCAFLALRSAYAQTASTPGLAAGADASDTTMVTCYVNWLALSQTNRTEAVGAIADFSYAQKATRPYTVVKGDNLWDIVRDTLHIADSLAFGSAKELIAAITQYNRLPKKHELQPGQIIQLPSWLPYLNGPLVANKVMTYDLASDRMQFYKITDDFRRDSSSAATVQAVSRPGISGVRMTLPQARQYQRELVERLGRAGAMKAFLYLPDSIVLPKINLLEGEESAAVDPPPLTELSFACARAAEIPGLHDSCFKDLVVIDVFPNDQCHHGRKVRNVIDQILHALELDRINRPEHVKELNADFGRAKRRSLEFMQTFFRSPLFRDDPIVHVLLDRLILQFWDDPSSPPMDNTFEMPELLLRAYLTKAYIEKASVVTTSFTVPCLLADPFPTGLNGTTTLLTAGLNEKETLEDWLLRDIDPNVPLPPRDEPLYTYSLSDPSFGTAVVGCRTAAGRHYGMRSRDGGKMLIGHGNGWVGPCILPGDSGTSFATPEAATLLYVAKAYWRSKRYTVTPQQTVDRMLLCTDLEPGFVGKFASGGPVSLCKLLCLGGAYLETKEGNVVETPIHSGSVIEYNGERLDPGSRTPSVRGLAYVGGSWFIFTAADRSWRAYEPAVVSLIVDIAGQRTTLSKNDIKTSYRQFAVMPKAPR